METFAKTLSWVNTWRADVWGKARTQVDVLSIAVSKHLALLFVGLFALIVSSAFSVVYSKSVYRNLYTTENSLQQQLTAGQVETSKLLLEQSTLTANSRVFQIANQQFGMVVPDAKAVTVLQ